MGAKTNATLAGAGTGAAIGSAGGPIGTAIGAGIGGAVGYIGAGGWWSGGDGPGERISQAEKLYGSNRNNYNLPGFSQSYDEYGRLANQYGGRQAPQAGFSAFRNQQTALGQQLAQEAGGHGIGQQLIRQQAQGQADRGMQQQFSMAAGARPGQGAAASRMAMMNAGNMNAQVGGQAAQTGGQYQLGAMNNYGQFLQGARGQDESMSQFNVNARLQQLGLNDRSQLDALSQRLQAQQAQQQGGLGYEGNQLSRFGAAAGSPTQGEQNMAMLQGGLQAYNAYKQSQNK